MAGRIVYADVPEPRATSLATRFFSLLGNGAVSAILAPATRTATVTWSPEVRAPVHARTAGPVVYVTWHRYNLASTPALLRLPPAERPTLIMHDGLASRALTHDAGAWFGFEIFVFRRRSRVSPRDQIAAYVRASGRSVMVLPDAGGPYGRVKPGSLHVAAACDAWIQPLVPRVRRRLVIGRTLRHVVPLPGCTVDVVWGDALAPGTSPEECQWALDALDPPAAGAFTPP
ncbi:MAG TPA: hypothetical protein VIF09_11240 [Polyangiaceae bacterium]|jgi:hypothetical protein